MDVTVREARPRDAGQVALLMAQLGYDVPASEIVERLKRLGDRRVVLVAVVEGIVVGWASLCVDEPFVDGLGGTIEGFVVDESMRSRGVGADLLRAAEAWSRERGCTVLRLHSNVIRDRAHAFYARHGYVTVKSQFYLRKTL